METIEREDLAQLVDMDKELSCQMDECDSKAEVIGVLIHDTDGLACSPLLLCHSHFAMTTIMQLLNGFRCKPHETNGTVKFYEL